jgi:hypothetical protein
MSPSDSIEHRDPSRFCLRNLVACGQHWAEPQRLARLLTLWYAQNSGADNGVAVRFEFNSTWKRVVSASPAVPGVKPLLCCRLIVGFRLRYHLRSTIYYGRFTFLCHNEEFYNVLIVHVLCMARVLKWYKICQGGQDDIRKLQGRVRDMARYGTWHGVLGVTGWWNLHCGSSS